MAAAAGNACGHGRSRYSDSRLKRVLAGPWGQPGAPGREERIVCQPCDPQQSRRLGRADPDRVEKARLREDAHARNRLSVGLMTTAQSERRGLESRGHET